LAVTPDARTEESENGILKEDTMHEREEKRRTARIDWQKKSPRGRRRENAVNTDPDGTQGGKPNRRRATRERSLTGAILPKNQTGFSSEKIQPCRDVDKTIEKGTKRGRIKPSSRYR